MQNCCWMLNKNQSRGVFLSQRDPNWIFYLFPLPVSCYKKITLGYIRSHLSFFFSQLEQCSEKDTRITEFSLGIKTPRTQCSAQLHLYQTHHSFHFTFMTQCVSVKFLPAEIYLNKMRQEQGQVTQRVQEKSSSQYFPSSTEVTW